MPNPKRRGWRPGVVIPVVVAVALLIGGGVFAAVWVAQPHKHNPTSTAPKSSAQTTPPTTEGGFPLGTPLPPFRAPAGLGANCQYQQTPNEPAAKPVTPPRSGKVPTDPATVGMSVTTDQGLLAVQLDNGQAPCTVNNFVSLAAKGYFNDTHCHRLTTGPTLFVMQCGDPKGDGSGGPGYQFADEYPSNQYPPGDPARSQPVVYPRGTLAMANAGPGTNGSQFFIVYKDSELPPDYTVFGKVDDEDLGVLDKIAAAGTVDGSPDGKPKIDVVITSARLD
jgi:peptidyl-prolyl cis-trans isomerase B (cyclophilin B)